MADVTGVVDWEGVRTWYRVVGDEHLDRGRPAVVVAHGGPGATHDYVEPLAELSRAGRACVFYDQVGAGRSSRHPDVPKAFWNAELFVRELRALLAHLKLGDYHFLGQSWGGMLGLQHALDQPSGLRSLIVANGLASIPGYIEGTAKLLVDLPADIADALVSHGTAGTTDHPSFGAAIEVFSRQHRLRLDQTPEPLLRTQQAMEADMTVYHAMLGNEFHVDGTLREWDLTARLHEINVPTLVITGRHDEVVPSLAEAAHRAITGSELYVFEHGTTSRTSRNLNGSSDSSTNSSPATIPMTKEPTHEHPHNHRRRRRAHRRVATRGPDLGPRPARRASAPQRPDAEPVRRSRRP
jgi:L-proline amide hydrolase